MFLPPLTPFIWLRSKTESTKVVMRYLAGLSQSGLSSAETLRLLESRVLQTNPILEGFGNARTLRNDNSSRFGKWISLEFDGRGRLARAALRTYLLEKVRLVRQAEGERGFHIFYESLASEAPAGVESLWPDGSEARGDREGRDSICVNGSTFGIDGRRDGVRDAIIFNERKDALEAFGMGCGDEEGEHVVSQRAVFTTLAAVLHLGALHFDAYEASTVEDTGSKVADAARGRLSTAADALGVHAANLERALTVRGVFAEGEVVDIKLSPEAAKRGRDALVKALYSSLFDELVAQCNAGLAVKDANVAKHAAFEGEASIGLLDIFGFEVFEFNSFEQLLINYTNERLQQHFTTFIFAEEQKEYAAEGLCWDAVDFPNNDDVLALIEGHAATTSMHSNSGSSLRSTKPQTPTAVSSANSTSLPLSMQKRTPRRGSSALPAAAASAAVGLLATIDDECLLVASKPDSATSDAVNNDADDDAARSLARRLKATFEAQPRYECTARQERSAKFVISHYAGPVEYSVVGFIAKNMDALSPDAAKLLVHSSRSLVRAIEQRRSANLQGGSGMSGRIGGASRRYSSLATTTVSQRFRTSLSSLLTEIRTTRPHFIRCLKPNDQNAANSFDRPRITEQLRYCGVLEAVRVARAGYPVRLPHADFVRRYRVATSAWSDKYYLRPAPTVQWTNHASSAAGLQLPQDDSPYQEETFEEIACDAAKTLVNTLAVDARLTLEHGSRKPSAKEQGEGSSDLGFSSRSDVGVAVGLTKIFLRKGAFEALEALLSKRVSRACTRVQTRWRAFREARRFAAARLLATRMQRRYRYRAARARACATVLSSSVRGWQQRRRFVAMLYMVRSLQRAHRGVAARAKLDWLRRAKAARRLQRLARGGAARGTFHLLRSAIISLQCFVRKMAAREARRKQYRMRRDAELVLKELYKAQDMAARVAAEMATVVDDARRAERRYELARCDAIAEKMASRKNGRTVIEAELARLRIELEETKHARDDARSERDAALTALSAAIAASGVEKREATEAAARRSLEAARRDMEYRRSLRDKEEAMAQQAAEAAAASEAMRREHAATSDREFRRLLEKKNSEIAAAEQAERERTTTSHIEYRRLLAQKDTEIASIRAGYERSITSELPSVDSSTATAEILLGTRVNSETVLSKSSSRRKNNGAAGSQPNDESDKALIVRTEASYRSERRIEALKLEIAALRRLICGGWMAQWRMLCELGEDPVPDFAAEAEDVGATGHNANASPYSSSLGPSAESLGEALGVSTYGAIGAGTVDYAAACENATRSKALLRVRNRRATGASVDPAALASRFAADIAALDAATAQLAGLRINPHTGLVDDHQGSNDTPPSRDAPYAAALAETLLSMERSSGCLRALASIEVSDFTPSQLRDQLDAAYVRLEDMQRKLDALVPRGRRPPTRGSSSIVTNRSNSAWLGIMSCGFYRDETSDGDS